MRRLIFIIFAIAISAVSAASQILSIDNNALDPDSVRRDYEDRPYFGLYKDNYFIFGPAVGQKITRANTNIKFQISVAQRLTRSVLPGGTFLYLFYSQKCFWNVLENSMPMTDLNFNPGIGLAKPIFVKNRYVGNATFMIEHESNGRDSIWSRSWNKVSLAANILVTKHLMVHGKVWIPIIDGVNNKDILHYCGIYQTGFQYISSGNRFTASMTLVKRAGKFFDYNTILEFAYRIFKRDNQFLFVQYYNGYGEGLLDYKQFHSQLRVGIVIKPKFFSEY